MQIFKKSGMIVAFCIFTATKNYTFFNFTWNNLYVARLQLAILVNVTLDKRPKATSTDNLVSHLQKITGN